VRQQHELKFLAPRALFEARNLGGEPLRGASGGTAGFAVVDALVALTILATIISLGAEALISARRLAFATDESQRAQVLLKYLLARGIGPGRDETGSLSGFNWRLRTTYLTAEPGQGPTLCRRWAGATDARSGRQYVLATFSFCTPPTKAAS
jgi:hypothetical protein